MMGSSPGSQWPLHSLLSSWGSHAKVVGAGALAAENRKKQTNSPKCQELHVGGGLVHPRLHVGGGLVHPRLHVGGGLVHPRQ